MPTARRVRVPLRDRISRTAYLPSLPVETCAPGMFCQVPELSDCILTVRSTAGEPPISNRPRTRNVWPLAGVVSDGWAVIDTDGAMVDTDAASAEAYEPTRAPLATRPPAITVVRPRRMNARRVDRTFIVASEEVR